MPCGGCGSRAKYTKTATGRRTSLRNPKTCREKNAVAVKYVGKTNKSIQVKNGHNYGLHAPGDIFCIYPQDRNRIDPDVLQVVAE